ncbi:unnamed protein product [Lathyrus sativus]|nr:unnamed protein product [Lathyrus sativus]
MRWRIDNGEKVRVWKDNWLSENAGLMVISLMHGLDSDAKVQELIDSDLCIWKNNLVQACFNQEEAKQILSIPISLRLPNDELVWNGKKYGEYSVRSVYHICIKEKVSKNLGPLTPLIRFFRRKFGTPRYKQELEASYGD